MGFFSVDNSQIEGNFFESSTNQSGIWSCTKTEVYFEPRQTSMMELSLENS